jgi:hypothetical protein
MGPGKSHQLQNVVIVNGIKHLASRSPRPHEPHGPQQPQLMGDSRFAHTYERRDVADAQLAICQRIEDPDASGIAKHTERFGEDLNRVAGHQRMAPLFAPCGVKMRSFAGILDSVLGFHGSRGSRHVNI